MLTLRLTSMLIRLIRLIVKEKDNGPNDTDAGSRRRVIVNWWFYRLNFSRHRDASCLVKTS